MLVGYARCSTDAQDLTAQRDALTTLGEKPNRIYVDHGLTGTNRARPGLREALAACRSGDTLVVTKLDRLSWDNQRLIEFIREAGCRDTLRYERRRVASELLLAVPDAIAWCWAKGGDW